MNRNEQKGNNPMAMLAVCMAALTMATCLAQTPPTNEYQEVLDFMKSPQGTNVTHKAQMLVRMSYATLVFSNELTHISTNSTIALPIRQLALEALQAYDNSATNSYQEIETFMTAWPFRDETPPPMTTNTILLMKRSLEISASASVHLQTFLSDTNVPSWYRNQTGQLYSNLIHHATHSP